MRKYLITIIAVLFLSFGIVHAQTIPGVEQWFYNIAGNYLYPTITGTKIRVPSLGSSGNPCVDIADTNGTFATTTCGSGGGGSTTINSLLGPNFTIAAGTGISVATSGPNTITVTNTGGGGSGVPSTTPYTSGYVPYATSTLALTNSNIYQDSSGQIAIATTTTGYTLNVAGNINATGQVYINGVPASTITSTSSLVGITNSASPYTTALGVGAAATTTTTGIANTFIGYQSGYSNTFGAYNTANGYGSLYSNTTGAYNTANGYQSLFKNTTGAFNTANGYGSLYSNTTGNFNTANGNQSLSYNTTGNYNTANGYDSLPSNTTGNYNTANGYKSLYNNTTGNYNVAVGYGAGTSGSGNYEANTFIGYNTNENNSVILATTTELGYEAGFNNTGNSVILLGPYSGNYNTINNAFYLNNVDQSNTANDKAYSLLYGNFAGSAGTTAGQFLTINAATTTANGNLIVSGNVGIGTSSPSQLLTVGNNNQFTVSSAGAATTTNLSVTTLTSGNCVQAGTGGVLQSASGACGSGSGGGVATTSPFTSGYVPYATSTGALTNSPISIQGSNITVNGNETITQTGTNYPTIYNNDPNGSGILVIANSSSTENSEQIFEEGNHIGDYVSNVLNDTMNETGNQLLYDIQNQTGFVPNVAEAGELSTYNNSTTKGFPFLFQQYGGNIDDYANYGTQGTFNIGTTTSLGIFDVATSTGQSVFNIASNGNVGIGTTSPINALSVIGDISGSNLASCGNVKTTAAGVLQCNSASYLTAAITSLNGLTGASQTFATTTGGSLWTITSSGTVHTWNIPATPTFTGITATNATTTTLSASGAVSFTSTLSVSATSTLATTTIAGYNTLPAPTRFFLSSTTPDSYGNSFNSATSTITIPPYPYAWKISNVAGGLDKGGTVLLLCGNGTTSSTPLSVGTTEVNTSTSISLSAFQRGYCQIGTAISSPDGIAVTISTSPQ